MGIRTGDGASNIARPPGGAATSAIGGRARVHGKRFVRGGEPLRCRGVTYGPFAPDEDGAPFPTRSRAGDDLAALQAAGANSIRVYHVPPEWFLELVDERGMMMFLDVPWSSHLCFLANASARAEALRNVRLAAEAGRGRPGILAYNIGNEIPTDVIRWHGTRRVARFLRDLADAVKQADPDALVTYASYPPTEYLELPFLDFVTFNVYLHDQEAFRDYLFRLQNLAGDRPLVLGELGLDTLRHGEPEQARFLSSYLREAELMGLAGAFVFSWTDDWHTGGFAVQDWSFGITRADRVPKVSYHAVQHVYRASLHSLLGETPKVSVVVCSHNGAATLDECLRSLAALDYPDCEVIVVDDGSTDETGGILARFPGVIVVHQAHSGLSAARNAGLRAATGALVAYTDSDCVVDRYWLVHLVHQLSRSGAAAVGGPNLSPDDGWLAACVAAAPGQPTHVLVSDQVAEHIPGCNMAFRREVLEAINGFDPKFRKAGDDVDICWRIQHEGLLITFAPGAFVWHHRRRHPRAYLRQQAGYGEAEALLHFKHPDRFNGRGEGIWRGVMYGASLQGLQLDVPIIYRGTFGTGMFQCLYQPGVAHWAMLPSTLEWQAAAALILLAGTIVGGSGWMLGATMLGLSVLVAALQAAQARPVPARRPRAARLLIAILCYVQPLVRSWARYRTRLASQRAPLSDPSFFEPLESRLPLLGHRSTGFWSETGQDRTELLRGAMAVLDRERWGRMVDTGWFDWDLAVYCGSGLILKVVTAQEEHGQKRRLIRVRYRLAPTARLSAIAALSIVALAIAALPYPGAATVAAVPVMALGIRAWTRGLATAERVVSVFRREAFRMNLIECSEDSRPTPVASVSGDPPAPADHAPDLTRSRGGEVRGAFIPTFPPTVAVDESSPSENRELFA